MSLWVWVNKWLNYQWHFIIFCACFLISDAYTTNDLNYTWKGGDSQGIEIVSSEMAQFDLTDVKTATKSQKNSKGDKLDYLPNRKKD